MSVQPSPRHEAPSRATPVGRVLTDLHERIRRDPPSGEVASYIPELSLADPETFGIALATVQGDVYEVGDAGVEFTVQSISKAVLYGMALEEAGVEAVAAVVGVEPTGEAFNSIRLDPDRGTPLNPMVNAGAIATTGLIGGGSPDERVARILATFERYTGRPARIDAAVHRSESETGHRNRAIAHLLRNSSTISGDPELVLDVYFRQCSILVTCRDLAVMGATLANRGVNPLTGARAIPEEHVPRVLTVMATCGMYDFAGQWLYDVGLPAKSGVAGGILAVLPGQLGLGTLSPPLDRFGNSDRGIRVCRALSDDFDLHLLDPPRAGGSLYGGGAPVPGASRRRRSREASAALAEAGDRVLVHRPSGDLTFATAAAMVRAVELRVPDGGRLVIDLVDVSRLDVAAATLLSALGDTLAERGAALLVCPGPGDTRLRAEIDRRSAEGDPSAIELWGDAEEALEWCEDRLLAELGVADGEGSVAVEECELCHRMSPEEVRDLAGALERVTFGEGDLRVEDGAPSDHLILLESGRASAVARRPDGSTVRVITIGPGMFMGEMGLIDGGPRSASVVADTPVVAHLLTRAALAGLGDHGRLGTRTVLLLNIAESLSRNLRRATDMLADRAF